jgi:hypothetical protein
MTAVSRLTVGVTRKPAHLLRDEMTFMLRRDSAH